MLARRRWIAVAAAAAFALAAAGLWTLSGREAAFAAAIAERGLAVAATVESKRVDTVRRRNSDGDLRTETRLLVTFAFEAPLEPGGPAVARREEASVPEARFNALREGDAVEVRYLPDDPLRVEAYPGQARGASTALVLASAFCALAAVVAGGIAYAMGLPTERVVDAQGRSRLRLRLSAAAEGGPPSSVPSVRAGGRRPPPGADPT